MNEIDLTGQRFGKLVVIDRAPKTDKGLTAWNCQCDCGNKCIATTKRLRNGSKKSCGCLSKIYKDVEIGDKYNYLTVIGKSEKKKYWVCQCDCGNTTEVLDSLLKNGSTKSCGCLKRRPSSRRLDLTNKKFGYLTALYFNKKESQPNRTYWHCRCACGNECDVLLENLTSPKRFPSCGCQTSSRGELKIEQLLNDNNIIYEKEKSFDSCINPETNRPLRFDFFVNNSYLIEFDGEQHFKDRWFEDLEEIQYRDNIKTQWCKDNNIPLIRIPYTKYKDLTIDDLLLQEPC